jgi:hypothetical protein
LLPNFIIYDENNRPLYKTFKRPFLDEFLKYAFENHNVSFWSAGAKSYVLDILKNILLLKYKPKMILWSDHCDQCTIESNCLKNIKWLSSKIPCFNDFGYPILIDDLEENIMCNPNNSILVKKFIATATDVCNDTELVKVKDKLGQVDPNIMKQLGV